MKVKKNKKNLQKYALILNNIIGVSIVTIVTSCDKAVTERVQCDHSRRL